MLPATLLTPAIRPLFASLHGGNEGAMHAFMALNMLGGFLCAPLVAVLATRLASRTTALAMLVGVDAILLSLLALPLPTAIVLGFVSESWSRSGFGMSSSRAASCFSHHAAASADSCGLAGTVTGFELRKYSTIVGTR